MVIDRRSRRLLSPALAGVLLLVASSGCAQFWDDATANSPQGGFRNNLAYRFELLFSRPDPFVVLRDSQDGDMRARALRKLADIHNSNKGDAEQQAVIQNILATAAISEKQKLCRLAAVETLGEIKDPGSTKALTDAFYAPANFDEKDPVVRMAALNSLAKVGDASAVETIVEAVSRDPSMDVRITAAEALGRFDHYQASQALVRVLKEEKNVALRSQAQASLQRMTGKDLPAKAEPWEEFFRQPPRTLQRERQLAQDRNWTGIVPAMFSEKR